MGVAVLCRLVAQAAQALGEGYDVEISEAHHRSKRDAPSGTALGLGEAVAHARGRSLEDVAVYARHGATGPRSEEVLVFQWYGRETSWVSIR
jgi:4-hydroxy-tetrahydrodipicolinate reductase